MAQIVDSFDGTIQTTGVFLYNSGTAIRTAQSFTGDGGVLNNVQVYLKKHLLPTGAISCKIYNHTGTYGDGSTGKPTGAAIATSGTSLDAGSTTTSFLLYTFTFSGVEKITLTNGTYYFISIEFNGGDSSNYLQVENNDSGGASGNGAIFTDIWSAHTYDHYFYVYNDNGSGFLMFM